MNDRNDAINQISRIILNLEKMTGLITGVLKDSRCIFRNDMLHCLCPFHQEKTASFSIKGSKYHCLSCGVTGSLENLEKDIEEFKMKDDYVMYLSSLSKDIEQFIKKVLESPFDRTHWLQLNLLNCLIQASKKEKITHL